MIGERPNYRAFISYSHRDRSVAAWLHHAIEGYRVPAKLVGRTTAIGTTPRRLIPVFRDRDELPASGDLGGELTAALERALFLIVICSPAAAASRWVGEEVFAFKRMHGDGRVLALIASGEPGASADPARAGEECFPLPLRFRVGADGVLSDVPAEPIAADLRPGADGRRLARLKIVAGLTGLGLDDLAQRDVQRRTRQLAAVAGASMTAAIVTGGLALYANAQRIEAQRQRIDAERQRNVARRETVTARTASDFLVDTFEIANPGSKNPRSISALDILGISTERARRQLTGQPIVMARVLDTFGRAYNNLGTSKDTITALEPVIPMFMQSGPEGVSALLTLSQAYYNEGRTDDALKTIDLTERALFRDKTKFSVYLQGRIAFNRGRLLADQGNIEGGLAAFNKAIFYFTRTTETRNNDLADLYTNRGLALSSDGKYVFADIDLRYSLLTYQQTLGENNLKTAFGWIALGANTSATGNHALAEAQVARALAIERKVLDPTNPILANALATYGEILRNLRRLPEAAAAQREAIGIYRTSYKGPHSLIGISDVYLALVERDRGRTRAALALLDDAKLNYDASYKREHPNHGDLLVHRATVLARAGRRAEAYRDCDQGMVILNRTLGADAAFTKQMGAMCTMIRAGGTPTG